jgi:protein-disulfide isomerase
MLFRIPPAVEDDAMSAQTKYAAMSRRAAMTAAALAAMATLSGCGGGSSAAVDGDMAMGAPEGAKVTVIEYASVTCHVCAAWHKENWAAFKAAYVDTNKVRFVFRELPTGPVNVAVAGFMIARCAGDDKYFDVVHNILLSQDEWQAGVNPRDTLFRIGNGAGLNNQQIETCIKDPENIKAAEARARASQAADIEGTPTFLVNGVKVVSPGSQSGTTMADLSRAIDAELAK